MILLMKRLRRVLLENHQFKKYCVYASGEMVLIILGILIALQIDNWNSDRQRVKALQNHLESIARNVRKDLESLSILEDQRRNRIEAASLFIPLIVGRPVFTLAEVSFFHDAFVETMKIDQFTANRSGYQSMNNSGLLSTLQGSDMEELLHDYYDQVERITNQEAAFNRRLDAHIIQVMTSWPNGLQVWELDDPAYLSANRFRSMQPDLQSLINGNDVAALMTHETAANALLLDYSRLEKLGEALIGMVERDTMLYDEEALAKLEEIYDLNQGRGYPDVMVDGSVAWEVYFMAAPDSFDPALKGGVEAGDEMLWRNRIFDVESIRKVSDAFHISYRGGAEWAGVWFFVSRGNESSGITSLDFSEFAKLRLELKGARGGETLLLNLEDSGDPQDGTSTRHPLTISDQWQTYEINLAVFETADLTRLSTAMGFVFLGDDPVAFSIRNIRYIKADE